MSAEPNARPLIAAATLVGLGMGGFVDGILFHQILQIHNMLSARIPKTSIPNIEINMVWDGLFHAFCWLMVMLGLMMLWSASKKADVPWSTKVFAGSLVLGWGLFNLVEGIIDHHILGIHHVVERLGVSVFDYAFLLSGVALIVIGWSAIRAGRGDASPSPGRMGRAGAP